MTATLFSLSSRCGQLRAGFARQCAKNRGKTAKKVDKPVSVAENDRREKILHAHAQLKM